MKQGMILTQQHPYMKGRSKVRIKKEKQGSDDGSYFEEKHLVSYGEDMQVNTKSDPNEGNRSLITETKKSGSYGENIQHGSTSQYDNLFGFTGSALPVTQAPQSQHDNQQEGIIQQQQPFLQQREFGLPQAVVLQTFNSPSLMTQQPTSTGYVPPSFFNTQKLSNQDAAVYGFKGGVF
jgi:hypothetical protein